MKNSWTKNAFWDVNNMKWRKLYKFVSSFLFNNTYGLPVHTKNTKSPNQVFYFEWSIYRIFVTNRCCKRDYLQIMIFVYVWSTWGIMKLKTRFETWITRNDVNGISLCHLPYLIALMVYLCSQWTPKVLLNYFMIDWY
jgi:hypothetical protein